MMELKISEEIFARQLIVSGNKTKSYSFAYPNASYHSCRQLGSLLSRSAKIKARLRELMEKHNLGLESCIKKLDALTEATKYQRYGQSNTAIIPDNFIRLQAVDTAIKINLLAISENESHV